MSNIVYGLRGTVFALVYGSAKFIVINVPDRSSGRVIMTAGLFVSAVLNIIMGYYAILSVLSLEIHSIHMATLIDREKRYHGRGGKGR